MVKMIQAALTTRHSPIRVWVQLRRGMPNGITRLKTEAQDWADEDPKMTVREYVLAEVPPLKPRKKRE